MKINVLAICLLVTAILTAQTEDAPVVPREDNIGYTASTDANYIYVTLTTEDHATMRSMLQRGFQVYFDKKGKKKKNVYVKYPKEMEKPERKERSDQQSTADREQQRPQRRGEQEETTEEEEGERRRPDFQKMMEQLPRVAEYQFFDTTEDVNLDINNQDIDIDYTYDAEADVLQYTLQIPINKVVEAGTDISKLSIGIISTEMEKQERQGQGASVSMGGMGQRGGGGGGQRGGGQGGGGGQRGGGGQGGGGAGQGGPPQQRADQQDNEINFWFKLYPKD